MNLKHLQVLLFFFVLFSFSCTSYKEVPYFQDLKRDSLVREKISNYSAFTLHSGDILAIHVTSLNHEADALINYNLEKPAGNLGTSINVDRSEENTVVGYSLDHEGFINLAYIGKIKVSGLTVDAVTDLLEEKLTNYLTNPIVTVRLQNFKISVLGDVKNPSVFNISNERITIIEALGLAGDLNTTGIRTNVLLVREINGKRDYVTIDLTSKKVFDSPYYYLKNNDVIYVQPNKEKINNESTSFQKATLVLTVISILAIVLSKHL